MDGAVPLVDAAEGLRRELELLDRVARGELPHALLQWSAPRALVVPRSTARKAAFAEAAAASAREGWPVHVRESGGGVVPLARGVLCVAMAWTSPAVRIEEGYRRLCAPLVAALADLGVAAEIGWVPGAFCDGAYNLVAGGRKIAGTAQRWKRARGGDVALAHAVLLVDADLEELVGAVDRFAARCGVEAARPAQHVTVAQLVPATTVDRLAERVVRRFADVFAK